MKKNIKRSIFLFSTALFSALLFVPLTASADGTDRAASYEGQTIGQGVFIEGTDVSGMNFMEAAAVAESYAKSFSDVTFTLRAGEDKAVEAKGADFGLLSGDTEVVERAIRYGKTGNPLERYMAKKRTEAGKTVDFPLSLRADYNSVSAFVSSKAPALSTQVTNNDLKRENGEFVFIKGTPGVSINVDGSAASITDFIAHSWNGENATLDLVTDIVQPAGDEEQLRSVKDVLGQFSTNYSSSGPARKTNIKVGTGNINGSLILPGGTLSVSTTMKPRKVENGYEVAAAYENGTTVNSVGGGVCQVSSTLYNAVIRAELEVVERSPHSMVVGYVEPSADAAIAEGGKDFVFRNNQNYPVYIEGTTNGSTVTFTVFGKETRPANRKVEYISDVLETIEPEDVFTANPGLPVGTVTRIHGAHTGYKAQLLKVVTVDGVEKSRDVFNRSSYRVTENEYEVGTASSRPDVTAAMNQVIATQDKAAIEAAAAQWNEEDYLKQKAAAEEAAKNNTPPAPTPQTPATEKPAPAQ